MVLPVIPGTPSSAKVQSPVVGFLCTLYLQLVCTMLLHIQYIT